MYTHGFLYVQLEPRGKIESGRRIVDGGGVEGRGREGKKYLYIFKMTNI
jgi:hypothetical protein